MWIGSSYFREACSLRKMQAYDVAETYVEGSYRAVLLGQSSTLILLSFQRREDCSWQQQQQHALLSFMISLVSTASHLTIAKRETE